jgi:hypothetical protein
MNKTNNQNNTMNMNATNAMFNLYDIRNAIPESVKSMPLHPEDGSDYSIGDAIDDAILELEELTLNNLA